jgi:uncharacterized protein YwlG (UPF0340 family)
MPAKNVMVVAVRAVLREINSGEISILYSSPITIGESRPRARYGNASLRKFATVKIFPKN